VYQVGNEWRRYKETASVRQAGDEMPDGPRDYEREYTDDLSPVTRIRLGYSHDRGEITRFVVQLEYQLDVNDWHEVVRYDHDSEGSDEATHDVEKEGLHIDIYRDGDQLRTEYVAPPMPAGVALDRAEDHLANNLEPFIQRFEEWHGIKNP
jgi:hypothetical protein